MNATERFGTVGNVSPTATNVLHVFDGASALERLEGASWYRDEHDFARALAETHWRGSSPRKVTTACGVLAAMSPMTPWDYTKRLALRLYRTGDLDGGTFSANVEKALRVYRGAYPLDVLGGPKVRSFYLALVNAGEDDSVVIDRHALHAALGQVVDMRMRGRILRGDGYDRVADCYRRVAEIVNTRDRLELTVSQVQATVWVTWRHWLLGESPEEVEA